MSSAPDQFEIDRSPVPSAKPSEQKVPASIRERLSAELPFDRFRASLADHGIGLLLAAAAFLLVFFTQRGIGWSWDEAYYYSPSQKAAEYFRLLATQPDLRLKMLSADSIQYYWSEIHECPALVKLLGGLALQFTRGDGRDIELLRLPAAALFALTIYLLYLLATVLYNRLGGLTAAIVYLTLPRVFGHAHIAATETALNFMLLLCVYLFLRGLNHGGWAVLWGIAFGLALNTKINAILLPPALLLWALLYRRRQSANNLFALLLLAPLVWMLTWPWLWERTLLKMLEYVAFFAQHQITGVYYLGRQWGYLDYPPPPWHYPPVLLLATTPLLALPLFACGALRAFYNTRFQPFGMLLLLIVLVQLAFACRPGAPKYDGVRLFLSIFPFLALLAGGAGALLPQIFSRERIEEGARLRWNQLAATIFVLLLAAAGGISLWLSAPRYLSYFNLAVGGIRGAAENPRLSFETTYWGDAVDQQVLDYLNRELPPECKKIKALALHDQVFVQHQQVFNTLRKDLDFTAAPPYDAHILQHRRGFFSSAEKLLLNAYHPVKTFKFRGVPLISIYLTPGGLQTPRPATQPAAPASVTQTFLSVHLDSASTDTAPDHALLQQTVDSASTETMTQTNGADERTSDNTQTESEATLTSPAEILNHPTNEQEEGF